MHRAMLTSKIHHLTVTQADPDAAGPGSYDDDLTPVW